jgi:ABC-type Co2+ transport system, periplasmic component
MKTGFLSLALLAIFASSPALAHDFWAGAQTLTEGQPLTAVLGFGHNFPEGEAIVADQIGVRYNPLKVLGPDGELSLKKGSETKLYVSEQPLAKGTYLVLSTTIPMFRSNTPEGWISKPKNEALAATTCRFASSFGKAVVNTGGAKDTALASKPVGHDLEIVPQINPAQIKAGQKFPVKVLFKGRPMPGASVEAFFAGFSDDGSYAFAGQTNQEGLINIIPLKGGEWLAKVSESRPYSDQAKCDTENYNASLTFTIAD